MSESVDLLLANGAIVTMDSGDNVFLNGSVAIRGRAIVHPVRYLLYLG
jgi:hypothetical protein